jgi:glucose/arabinose dehydrogenase
MYKRNAAAICCLIALLTACPAIFYARTNPVTPGTAPQDKVDAVTAVQLQTVFTGLSNTVYVTNAHDGTNRLFVIEKVGRIRVAQPGSATTSVFLNITSRVLSSGNEQGLLGLAFHPQYFMNGRFFVFYTRPGDGALVIAEYHRLSSDQNAGDPASEIVILTIPHPTNTNHNGGMIEFGRDGYLYVGTGDGGSGNDPPNNAQNINSLLGKILRIDIDHPNGSVPYTSPADNPFSGSMPGADEIYAVGMRNPWRFSFDRGTSELYAGDVGQGAWEEIDIITRAGNYGWRVFEGKHCTGLDSNLCNASSPCNINGYTCPIFEYDHSSGRCSETGGYVYRGARSAVPTGLYIFADYCTGEIWQLNPPDAMGNRTRTLLIDTAFNITSFGEDEAGEIYVVAQSGTISRLTSSPPPADCSFSISQTSQFFPLEGGEGIIDLTTTGDCAWAAATNVSWITLSSNNGVGGGPFSFFVRTNPTTSPRSGTINIAGKTFTVVQDSSSSADCVYTINPTTQAFSKSGGTGTITVVTESRCAWQATATPNWITVTGGQIGTGDGTVSFSVAANPVGGNRKGTITIGNQIFRVKQK